MALPLEGPDIALLSRVAARDWAEVAPSIFGPLFERGLDPDKRSQLGTDYTDRDKIGLPVDAVVVRPLLGERDAARVRATAAMDIRTLRHECALIRSAIMRGEIEPVGREHVAKVQRLVVLRAKQEIQNG